jgi:hypothetical protein
LQEFSTKRFKEKRETKMSEEVIAFYIGFLFGFIIGFLLKPCEYPVLRSEEEDESKKS